MKLTCVILSLVAFGYGTMAPAAAKTPKKAKSSARAFGETEGTPQEANYTEVYGMAGCGLWSSVITSKSRDAQLGVWALRVLPFVGSSDSQTSGITSGTSNCVESRAHLQALEKKVFVEVNLASLHKEAAQGTGQHLAALAEIFGCPHSDFARLSQGRYGQIYTVNDPDMVLANYRREVQLDAALAASCHRVG